MQESQVDWDPMIQPALPWYARLYLIFLFVLLISMIVRFLRILWQTRRKFRSEIAAVPSAKDCAEAALRQAYDKSLSGDANMLDKATVEFDYIWHQLHSRVVAMTRWVRLTLLITSFVFSWQVAQTGYAISTSKYFGSAVIGTTMVELGSQIGLGIFVCTVIYVMTVHLQGVLEKRRIQWNYFSGTRR
jgi:small-conductance mechanosensitive channel